MAERTGVDIILSARDETGGGFASVNQRLGKLGNAGFLSGKQLQSGIMRGLGGLALVRGIDSISRQINDGLNARKTGLDIGMDIMAGIEEGLARNPLTGGLVSLLAREVDALFGDPMKRNKERLEANQIAATNAKLIESFDALAGSFNERSLTEFERERSRLEKQLEPLVNAMQAIGVSRDVRTQNADRVRAALEADQNRRRDEAIANDRRAIATRVYDELQRQRQRSREFANVLPAAQEFGSVSTRAMMFRAQQARNIAAAQQTPQQQLKEQKEANSILLRILREDEETRRAIERIQTGTVNIQVVNL